MIRFSGILKNWILKIIKSNKLEKQSFGSNIKIRQIYTLKFFLFKLYFLRHIFLTYANICVLAQISFSYSNILYVLLTFI